MTPSIPDLEHDEEILEAVADQEVMDYIDGLQESRKKIIEKEANKRIKKNRREISRLRKHAENCLIDDNKAGYMYSIGKLRKITGQVVSEEVLETLYKTSREQVIAIATSFAEARCDI